MNKALLGMVIASPLSSAAISAILALGGALGGLSAAVVVARLRLRRREIERFEAELAEQVQTLRRADPDRISMAVEEQEHLLGDFDQALRSQVATRRLLVGYLTLATTAAVVGLTALDISNVAIHGSALVWGVLALAITGGAATALFWLARAGSVSWNLPTWSFEAELVEPAAPLATRRAALELGVREWLETEGWKLEALAPTEGFDALASRNEDQMLVEIKARARLSTRDIDALLGAAGRYATAAGPQPRRLSLFVPVESLEFSKRALEVAANNGVDVYSVTPDGRVASARPALSDSGR